MPYRKISPLMNWLGLGQFTSGPDFYGIDDRPNRPVH